MKKFNFKGIICGFMAGVMVTAAIPVLAYNGTKTISAAFKNIKIYIDGAELTPRDASGNVLEPFIYNGSTYLPIRAVGEAVGKSVSYDANTNSVYLGSSSNYNSSSSSATLGTKLKPYQTDGIQIISDISMGGVSYKEAVNFGSSQGSAYVYYNLSGSYNSVSGIYGSIDDEGSIGDYAVLSFYGDGILLKEFTVNGGELPKNFTLNLTGVSQLRVEGYVPNGNSVAIGLADMYFK
ncbi:MAG: NPCBM/NEW2 domain-containing protein [Clostridiales bacterium]|nr:NPCBM/NEW2 domain-containing protein [Clostridiales bacterium]